MTPDERLDELHRKIDAFTARVIERYPDALACAAGCAECCRRELTVTAVEAERIVAFVLALPEPARAALAERASSGEPCAALLDDGRCGVYEARPIVCRSHGLPLRFEEPEGPARRALPVIDVCPKNFSGQDLAAIDPPCVLDQRTLSILLGAIDGLFTREIGAPDAARYPLRDVLAEASASPAIEASES